MTQYWKGPVPGVSSGVGRGQLPGASLGVFARPYPPQLRPCPSGLPDNATHIEGGMIGHLLGKRFCLDLQGRNPLTKDVACSAEAPLHPVTPIRCPAIPPAVLLTPPGELPPALGALLATLTIPGLSFGVRDARTAVVA